MKFRDYLESGSNLNERKRFTTKEDMFNYLFDENDGYKNILKEDAVFEEAVDSAFGDRKFNSAYLEVVKEVIKKKFNHPKIKNARKLIDELLKTESDPEIVAENVLDDELYELVKFFVNPDNKPPQFANKLYEAFWDSVATDLSRGDLREFKKAYPTHLYGE